MSDAKSQNVSWARHQIANGLRRTAYRLRDRRERQGDTPHSEQVDLTTPLTASDDRSDLESTPNWFLPNGLFPTLIPEEDGPRLIKEQGGDPSQYIFIHLRSGSKEPVRPAPFGGRHGGGDGYVSVIGLWGRRDDRQLRPVNLLTEDPTTARELAGALIDAAETIEQTHRPDVASRPAGPDGELGLDALVEALVKLRLDDNCDHAYWRQRFELLLDALDVNTDAARQLRLIERDAGRSVVPLRGAEEVPEAIAAASHMVDDHRVRRLQQEIRELTSTFIRDVAVAADPGSRGRSTTLAQLKALGLQEERNGPDDL